MRVDDLFKKVLTKNRKLFYISKTLNRARQIFLYDDIILVYSFDLIVYMFLIRYELITISIYYIII